MIALATFSGVRNGLSGLAEFLFYATFLMNSVMLYFERSQTELFTAGAKRAQGNARAYSFNKNLCHSRRPLRLCGELYL